MSRLLRDAVVKVDVLIGTAVDKAVMQAAELSTKHKMPVEFDFNGMVIRVTSKSEDKSSNESPKES